MRQYLRAWRWRNRDERMIVPEEAAFAIVLAALWAAFKFFMPSHQ